MRFTSHEMVKQKHIDYQAKWTHGSTNYKYTKKPRRALFKLTKKKLTKHDNNVCKPTY